MPPIPRKKNQDAATATLEAPPAAPAAVVQASTPAPAPPTPHLMPLANLGEGEEFTMPDGGSHAGGKVLGLNESEANVCCYPSMKVQNWSTSTMVYPGAPARPESVAPTAPTQTPNPDGSTPAPRKPRTSNAPGPNGLTPKDAITLAQLAKAGDKGLTRPELTELTGITKGWSAILGAVSKGILGDNEGLVARGLVRYVPAAEAGGKLASYAITDAGRAALGAGA